MHVICNICKFNECIMTLLLIQKLTIVLFTIHWILDKCFIVLKSNLIYTGQGRHFRQIFPPKAAPI